MKKERIKNIALTVLVIMNIVLGSKILNDKKLWPSGYNFFSGENFPVINFFVKDSGEEKGTFEGAHRLTRPEKIIFNTGDQTTRFSLTSNTQSYYDVSENCDEIIVTALSNTESSISEVEKDEWFSALMTKSLYLSYFTEYKLPLFAKFFGVHESALSDHVSEFSNVVITLSDNVSVYIEDLTTDRYYRVKTGRKFEDFKAYVEELTANRDVNDEGGNAINYSFDLNFDKAFGEQKTIISSLVPIYSNTQNAPAVNISSPLENADADGAVINKIVRAFNVNANAAKRYTEADATVVYVENNATLKIHTNGMVEYRARDDGILLSESDESYNTVLKLNEFISKVNTAAGVNDNMYLSSELSDDMSEVTFDYICEGMPVDISWGDAKNAVFCEISGGHIKEYRQILRNYEKNGEYVMTPEYINAVDDTIQQYSGVTGEITINKLYIAYKDTGENITITPDWKTEVHAVILEE